MSAGCVDFLQLRINEGLTQKSLCVCATSGSIIVTLCPRGHVPVSHAGNVEYMATGGEHRIDCILTSCSTLCALTKFYCLPWDIDPVHPCRYGAFVCLDSKSAVWHEIPLSVLMLPCSPWCQHGVLTPVENVTYPEETVEKSSGSSPQSVSRKILARRKAAKERNSKVCVCVRLAEYGFRSFCGNQDPTRLTMK